MTDRRAEAPISDNRFESLGSQVERLARFIMEEIPGEPSQNEGAIDCAIRLLRAAHSGSGEADRG